MAEPMYRMIADDLRRKIESGELPVEPSGPLLLRADPHPVAELAVRFGDGLARVPADGCLDRHLATGRQLVTRLSR